GSGAADAGRRRRGGGGARLRRARDLHGRRAAGRHGRGAREPRGRRRAARRRLCGLHGARQSGDLGPAGRPDPALRRPGRVPLLRPRDGRERHRRDGSGRADRLAIRSSGQEVLGLMRRLVLVSSLLGALLLPSAGTADNPVLTGDVGLNDAFVISLEDASGTAVTHLDPGTYTLVVHDHSALHNFRMFGPGTGDAVNVATDVDFVGDKTFTITLTAGTYTFNCDPHFTVMKGTFTVGTVPPSPPTTNPGPTPPPPKPTAARLAASVGPGARIAVRGAA